MSLEKCREYLEGHPPRSTSIYRYVQEDDRVLYIGHPCLLNQLMKLGIDIFNPKFLRKKCNLSPPPSKHLKSKGEQFQCPLAPCSFIYYQTPHIRLGLRVWVSTLFFISQSNLSELQKFYIFINSLSYSKKLSNNF